MTTIITCTIGESKGVARLWLEGQKLFHAGVSIGTKYLVRAHESMGRLELVPVTEETGHTCTVSKRERYGVVSPLLEIRTELLSKIFDGLQRVRVAIREGRIVVTPLQIDIKIRERVQRLKQKLAQKAKLATVSLFHGGGVMDMALHTGLMAMGVASFIQVGVEMEQSYLDASLRNNPELWTKDSIAICSDIREVGLRDNVPPADLLVGGVPCTGASLAGRAKNKLARAEDHSSAGTLFLDYLEMVRVFNPAVVVLENVKQYADTASMAVIRSRLTSLGYVLFETVLNGTDFGALESRSRLIMVAITRGLEDGFDFNNLVPTAIKPINLGKVLDDIPDDSDRWKTYEYLAAKEERDIAAGKGFKRQIVTPESPSVGTIGRGFAKARSTEPFLAHPTDPKLSRLFTPLEHARIKGAPSTLVDGLSETTAHEVLGQSVVFPKLEAVGRLIGASLNYEHINPDYLEVVRSGVTSYCDQVCGNPQCGSGQVCGLGIDTSTRMPPLDKLVLVPSKAE
ncbi:DNA cytosine methyltransferase [Pseudomonas aeruginosa]|uniref:DNA cytosine methyltransferase n=1 Tax=Pseudomonas aeruginosa TaxID=287 RepID=UPI00071B7BF7|nr:DNA cytosine methyltransferase [Pseudomonas aeruginosa]KSQ21597.1 DNA cytosine methyltransferase [Pseudomonas aeruginosa]RPV61266.1 DNA cytosine methyltransferase [Pseudomonas aeruginosa]